MKKLFFLTLVVTALFTVTNVVYAQDTCKCQPKVKHLHQTPKAKGNVTYVEINDNDTTKVSFHQELTINTGKDSDGGNSENSNNGSSAWPWVILGIVAVLATAAIFIPRRPRAIHEFVSDETIEAVANNGGWFSHSRGNEKIRFRVDRPSAITVQLRNGNQQQN
jgi:hypothetical protein